jgi:hypothetical protein
MGEDQALVEGGVRRYGRLATRPARVNPLDEYSGTSRSLRALRLKEWVGFTLIHPDWFSSLIIQDAHYLSSSEIYAHDRARKALYQHASTIIGSLGMPAGLYGERIAYTRPGYSIRYDFGSAADAAGTCTLTFDIAATATAPAFRGEVQLHRAGASAPLSVSSRLPGGKLYTYKALFPVSGALSVGDEQITFDPARDMAILDEHKSLFPYRTRWLWGTLATRADGAPVGANFCARPLSAGEEEESCIWTPHACEPLSDITFEPARSGDPLAPWHVHSADGRLDLTFEPEGRKGVRHQLVVVEIDYFQLYGHYRGVLRATDGQAYDIDGVHGVCESFKARLLPRRVQPADRGAVTCPAEWL